MLCDGRGRFDALCDRTGGVETRSGVRVSSVGAGLGFVRRLWTDFSTEVALSSSSISHRDRLREGVEGPEMSAMARTIAVGRQDDGEKRTSREERQKVARAYDG